MLFEHELGARYGDPGKKCGLNMKLELSSLPLGELTIEDFLTQYWQKKPLLIRNAIPDFNNPISPDELAGLACEETIESRIVIERPDSPAWEVRHGPFTQQDFESLPEDHWTLLVQDVEKHVPELYELIQLFRFIPDWRIDDLMISYATDHGSVGPHTDAYDVFLLQGMGKRHWKINTQPVSENNVIEDLEICVMKDFTAEQEWTLEPGDILYLPPNIAHHGIALGECMTYSIGFRAPGHYELLHGFLEHKLENAIEKGATNEFYRDPDLKQQKDPARISSNHIANLRAVITDLLPQSTSEIDRWIGMHLSKAKEHLSLTIENKQLNRTEFIRLWQEKGFILRNTAVRILYLQENDQCIIFANGYQHSIPEKFSESIAALCRTRTAKFELLRDWLNEEPFAELLCQFHNSGYLYFENE